ncbi:MAG TPA: hypothetical protein VMZ25_00995 [Terriglobales bacterium]|nr:hypothetical protein [Terriglobales bacterium]
MALLHSFTYEEAGAAFRAVAKADSHCAMAHWGLAAAYIHPLWEPSLEPGSLAQGRAAIADAQRLGAASAQEQRLIAALAAFYAGDVPNRARALAYEAEMAKAAQADPRDAEVQIFYALSVLATVSPADATHAHQKKAAAILEPLRTRFPAHPGIIHYLIHAYDNQELARQGLAAAREYSRIAPSAPHALHMPSHTFTRLGLWSESIASNRAARRAAEQHGDTGEVLHSMDYLMYAYLQSGRAPEAKALLKELAKMKLPESASFKIGYAASAMPVRYALERKSWAEALALVPPSSARPEVAALTHWARALAASRSGDLSTADSSLAELVRCHQELLDAKSVYWSAQVGFQVKEAQAWIAFARKDTATALRLMREAADEEDALDKLPITPGPVIPAREQLGDLLLALDRAPDALKEFEKALRLAPGRRNSIIGARRAYKAQSSIAAPSPASRPAATTPKRPAATPPKQ